MSTMIKNVKLKVERGGATKPYVEYKLNENGEPIAAKLYGFTTIPEGMFAYMKALVTVDLTGSPGITSIGKRAFGFCENLETINLPDSVAAVDDFAFYGCAKLRINALPASLAIVGADAFWGCALITATELPAALTQIGSLGFYGCTGLEITELPASLSNISGQAFGASGVKITKIPSTVTRLGYSAFVNCMGLTHMEIACSSISGSNSSAPFKGCKNLEKVWLRSNLQTITFSQRSSAPFVECSTDLQIYAEPAEKPEGWQQYFNSVGINGASEATVTYGQTERPW